MIALLGAVIAGGVISGVHCVAMCGPLVALHGQAGLRHGAVLHHAGRLGGYVVLGALAGGIGSAVDLAGRAIAIQRAAMIVAGLVIIAAGLVAFATALGWQRRARPPALFDVAVARVRRVSPGRRAALLGALSAALPCGLLWAFVVTAAGTAHPLAGAAVMTAFWLGTLPLLLGATVVLAPLLGVLRARMPVVTAILLLALGTAALAMRAPLLDPAPATIPACHDHAAVPR
jgi:sulfite exporter TauE/SafE